MLGTIARSLLIPLALAAWPAVAAPPDTSGATNGALPAPGASGSSAAVPAGKVALPPLPLAKMPDTRMPKEPDLAPLPATAGERQPVRAKP